MRVAEKSFIFSSCVCITNTVIVTMMGIAADHLCYNKADVVRAQCVFGMDI